MTTDGIADTVEEWNLTSHLIDADTVRQDDFEAFFEARQRALLERIGRVMGKQLIVEDYIPDDSAHDDVELFAAQAAEQMP